MIHTILSKYPGRLWREFEAEITPEVASRCYRTARGFPAYGELVWEILQDRLRGDDQTPTLVRVGWGSLITDPLGTAQVLYRGGVFPQYQREGLIDEISLAMARLAFSDPLVQWVTTAILFSNPAQVARRLRRASEGHWWGYPVGMTTEPAPGALFFALPRSRWSTL